MHHKFKPYLTPKDILLNGAFGGSYFGRREKLQGDYDYQSLFQETLSDVPSGYYRQIDYITKLNMFKVKSGMSYQYWLDKGWIHEDDPHRWFEWYLKYWNGRRHEDDERQISRWNGVCGIKGRWRNRLYKNISETGNWQVSPRIQQSLLHWGYLANKKDYELYLENQ